MPLLQCTEPTHGSIPGRNSGGKEPELSVSYFQWLTIFARTRTGWPKKLFPNGGNIQMWQATRSCTAHLHLKVVRNLFTSERSQKWWKICPIIVNFQWLDINFQIDSWEMVCGDKLQNLEIRNGQFLVIKKKKKRTCFKLKNGAIYWSIGQILLQK